MKMDRSPTSFARFEEVPGSGPLPARHPTWTPAGAPAQIVRLSPGMINRAVAMLDAGVFVAVAVLCQRFGPSPLTPGQSLTLGLIGAAAYLGAAASLGAYRLERYGRPTDVLGDLILGILASAAVGGVLLWSFAPPMLATGEPVLVWATATLAGLSGGRLVAGGMVARARRSGRLRRRAAVVGATPLGLRLVERLATEAEAFELVGWFDDGAQPGMGSPEDLRLIAQSRRVDLIVLAVPLRDQARIASLLDTLQWISADVAVALEEPDLLGRYSLMTDLAGFPALILGRHPLRGTQGLVKVAQDYVIAAVALIVAGPVMAACALAILLQKDGPVLFRQARVGFNGRTFHCYKFRTMTVDASDDGSVGTAKDNPRITRLGAFLRRTSLDELPQIFNVLRGEMSIVGPRPHVPNMLVGDSAYAKVVRAYAARCQLKPGITGWAQINGMRGGIHTAAKARAGVDLDLYYIRNWSLALDLKIIFRTVTLNMAGADVF